jgi:DNA-binding PadR family transcriptional regulator
MEKISKELVGASANPIILSILSNGDTYGYEIIQRVKELSDDKIHWKEGSIYPVLKKLELSGCIKSYWKMEDQQRPRKYYSINEAGRQELAREKEEWYIVQAVFAKLWK